jgi:hypothetical protein
LPSAVSRAAIHHHASAPLGKAIEAATRKAEQQGKAEGGFDKHRNPPAEFDCGVKLRHRVSFVPNSPQTGNPEKAISSLFFSSPRQCLAMCDIPKTRVESAYMKTRVL